MLKLWKKETGYLKTSKLIKGKNAGKKIQQITKQKHERAISRENKIAEVSLK